MAKTIIETNRAETLAHVLTYKDDGTAVDITGATFAILDSYPTSIGTDASFSITDAANGQVTMSMTNTQIAALEYGCLNWFIVSKTQSGAVETTPKIWIEVVQ